MVLVMGIAVAINIIVIMWKIEKNRQIDALIDTSILVLLSFVFMKTITGMMVSTVASSIVSMYLLYKRPDELIKQLKGNKNEN